MTGLYELRNRIDKSVCSNNDPADTPSMAKLNEDDCRMLSPIAIRRKGRPPFKRKVSRVDVAIRWKKETIRKNLNLHVFKI